MQLSLIRFLFNRDLRASDAPNCSYISKFGIGGSLNELSLDSSTLPLVLIVTTYCPKLVGIARVALQYCMHYKIRPGESLVVKPSLVYTSAAYPSCFALSFRLVYYIQPDTLHR